jgi:signal transduction histidine kinase
MKVWPRTLGMQLIVVTAAAVFLSNLGVAIWFQLGTESLSETELMERVVDRAVSAAVLMSSIPPEARAEATHALSGNGQVWDFSIHNGPDISFPMSADEAKLAARLDVLLPDRLDGNRRVSVRFRDVNQQDAGWQQILASDRNKVIEMVLPAAPGVQLVTKFFRPPVAPWPTEISLAAVLAILLASAATAYIARRVARPLSKLAEAASVAARGGPAPRVPEIGPDDVRNAAIAFNAMTDQVTRTMESQRHLLSAVGHDLRTPITAMRINTEFVEDQELRERLQANLDELQALTEAVLSAARGTGGEERRQVDLAALVESLCADLDDMGEPVAWKGHPPAPVCCRPNEVRRAVRNLVENAVAYGKKADVGIDDGPDAYEIVIEDEGPGIPKKDLKRVFEPFVRLESSRNSETGGSGLGLTLVKAIAEGHGGDVVLEDRAGGGLRARLKLPRSQVLV